MTIRSILHILASCLTATSIVSFNAVVMDGGKDAQSLHRTYSISAKPPVKMLLVQVKPAAS
jgi:hypothetical protein